MIFLVICTLLLFNLSAIDSSASKVMKNNMEIRYNDYHYEMIFVEDGGSLVVDIETDGEIELFLIEESQIQSAFDYLRKGSGDIENIYMGNINGKERIDIKKSGSGNVIIFIINNYSREIVEKSGDPVSLSFELEANEKSEKWNIDLTILPLIIVPVLVFILVVYWIRKRS